MPVPSGPSNLKTDFQGTDSRAGVHAAHHDALATAVNAIEAELLTGAIANVVYTSDTRLTNARTPTAHTHLDPVVLASYVWDLPTGALVKGLGFSLGACTITQVRAIRTGGSAASINFRLRGTDLVVAGDLVVNTVYTQTTTLAFTALADTDRIEAMLQSVGGAPASVEVFLIGTRTSQ